jgi:hypothetical protein
LAWTVLIQTLIWGPAMLCEDSIALCLKYRMDHTGWFLWNLRHECNVYFENNDYGEYKIYFHKTTHKCYRIQSHRNYLTGSRI